MFTGFLTFLADLLAFILGSNFLGPLLGFTA